MLNHIELQGRLTRDPELRFTQSQKPVANFTLAVDRDAKNKATDFIDIIAFNGLAEFVSKNINKGQMIVLTGRLQMRDWTDRDGGKRKATEVIADNVYFCGKRETGTPAETVGQLPI